MESVTLAAASGASDRLVNGQLQPGGIGHDDEVRMTEHGGAEPYGDAVDSADQRLRERGQGVDQPLETFGVGWGSSKSPFAASSNRSVPAENARPAPVMTTTETPAPPLHREEHRSAPGKGLGRTR